MLSSWLRVIRIRFLLASVIAVLLGLAISWWTSNTIDIFHAILIMIGVLSLHASIDLLNDYWDFKRGIDTQTKRTKVSAKRDGSLGYFGRGKMVKQFEEAAFKLEVGKISEPIKSEFGYHIIKRLG